MGGKKTPSSRQFNYKKLLFLLIPTAALLAFGIPYMGLQETLPVLKYFFTLQLFGLAFAPLANKLFLTSRSGGFLLAKPLGIAGVSFIVWTLTYLKIARFNLFFVILALCICAACCWSVKSLREEYIDTLRKDSVIESIAVEETVLALALIIMCFYKGFRPDINGEEKFMDYGFIMSMLRNSELPANDMWLSGESINYYYYGQFMHAMIIKLSGVAPSYGYNIAMCCSIAMPFAMCFSIGQALIDCAAGSGARIPRYVGVFAGLFSGCAVMLFGNSHSFYYDENSAGNKLLSLFSKMGINVGETTDFFYPDSTRYIGYNPDSSQIEGIANGADKTIEEFPFYSYLIGDLHAHVCSTMIVILLFAVALNIVMRSVNDTHDMATTLGSFKSKIRYEVQRLMTPGIITYCLLLGIAQMTNYWDFLIYFIFGAMILLVTNTKNSRDFSSIPGVIIFAAGMAGILGIYLVCGQIPLLHALLQALLFGALLAATAFIPTALSRTVCGMSLLFSSASVASLPFNMNFDMISNKIALCVNHSSPYQLFILWGTHVIICLTFLGFTIYHTKVSPVRGKKSKSSKRVTTEESFNPVQKFFNKRNTVDVFMCGVIVVALLLLAAPEIFYVRDIYTSGYLRANTMFKFTYAAFIILSLSMVYSIFRLMFFDTKKDKYSAPGFVLSVIFLLLMIFVPGHYTLTSLGQRTNASLTASLSRENFKTLDGTKYLENYASSYVSNVTAGNLSDYDACIDWFNAEIEGDPVILEAYGLSYTDYNIVSAYTGLPSVCGWQTHEHLWRFHGIVNDDNEFVSDPDNDVWKKYLTPRHNDIDTVYTSTDVNAISEILEKYDVEYVILGDLERAKYPNNDNTALISSLGEIAFSSGTLMVIRIL